MRRNNSVINKINSNNNNNKRSYDERPQAKIWLNIGFYREDLTDNNGNPVKCCLPVGVPLDTMKDGEVRANAPQILQDIIDTGNALKEELLNLAEDLEPGDYLDLGECTKLTIFLQKANEEHRASPKAAQDTKSAVRSIFKSFKVKDNDSTEEDENDTPF